MSGLRGRPDSDPERLLADLVERVPGARSAVLLSTGGLALAEHKLGSDDADRLAALASGMFSAARNASTRFGNAGGVRQVVAELDDLILFSVSAGTSAVLTVLAGRETDAKLLVAEMGEVIQSVQPFLATQPRIRGVVTRADGQSRGPVGNSGRGGLHGGGVGVELDAREPAVGDLEQP